MRILILAADQTLAEDLARVLSSDSCTFLPLTAPVSKRRAAAAESDILIVDAPVVDERCLSLCRSLQSEFAKPLAVCSVSDNERDIVRALNAGADEYIALPVRPQELSARLHAMRRRAGTHPSGLSDTVLIGDLEIDMRDRKVNRDGRTIDLTPIEFKLLTALLSEAGRPIPHSQLLYKVWGPEYADCRNYLRLYIRYLRSKLEVDPRSPRLILNEWGIGYRLDGEIAVRPHP